LKKIGGEFERQAITLSPALPYRPKKNSRLAYSGGSIWTI
jgi:hypothetical protein